MASTNFVNVINSTDPRLALNGCNRVTSFVKDNTGNAAAIANRAFNSKQANRPACGLLLVADLREPDASFDILTALEMAEEAFADARIIKHAA